MQGELLRVSRLDAMGQMTLAIAHELNQPLAAISNYVNAAKLGLRAENPTSEKGLHGFVEKREMPRAPADLGLIVEEALALTFVSAVSAGVKVILHLDSALPPVLVDRVQIQQLLFNLIRNSLEAMQSSGKRELTLETQRIPGDFAEVTVQDSGPGLETAIGKDLFKPFNTNKHDGMGVGLTICQAIVESHHGQIWLAHRGTDGTTFRFNLPLSPEKPG